MKKNIPEDVWVRVDYDCRGKILMILCVAAYTSFLVSLEMTRFQVLLRLHKIILCPSFFTSIFLPVFLNECR